MRNCLHIFTITFILSFCQAGIYIDVLTSEGAVVDCSEIMAGTHLVFVIGSDESGVEENAFFYIPVADVAKGEINGRGQINVWEGSILPAAGSAYLYHNAGSDGTGFLFSTYPDTQAGDWFIFDYYATDEGPCTVLYDNDLFTDPKTLYEIPFMHVPTRDFHLDGVVDFLDMKILAENWQAVCDDPNHCEGKDLDKSGLIDPNDLSLFSKFWLEKTD